MNWRPALPALSRSAGVHGADPAPDPLRSKGSPTACYQRPVLGHSGPSCRGARPTNPQGAARLHFVRPATMRTSGGLAAPRGGHLRWCLETEHPPKGGSQGRPRRQAGPLRAPAPTPAASRAWDEAWGRWAQSRLLERRGRRPGPRSGPGFRGDPHRDDVASEVSVRVRWGLEGCGGQWLHPRAPRQGLEHQGGGTPWSRPHFNCLST